MFSVRSFESGATIYQDQRRIVDHCIFISWRLGSHLQRGGQHVERLTLERQYFTIDHHIDRRS